MRIPTLDNCCCCLSLRTGSAITGALLLVEYTWICISTAVKAEDDDYEDSRNLLICCSVLASIMALLNVLLLYGVLKESAMWLKPWLGTYVVLFFIVLILAMLLVLQVFAVAGGAIGIFALGVVLIFLALLVYKKLVVYSYYVLLTGGVSAEPM